MNKPDTNKIFPVQGANITYIKPTITRSNIEVGDFSYFSGENFEEHVTHHYDFIGDRLIIGKFCQIASGVEIVMNGANHQMNAISTYPFNIFREWEVEPPLSEDLAFKGNTIIGNDVWIGQNVTILPGVHIGDGAIIGMNSVVSKDIPSYSIVAGNPSRIIRKRYDDELIGILSELKWWDKSIESIKKIIPLLLDSDLEKVKKTLTDMINKKK